MLLARNKCYECVNNRGLSCPYQVQYVQGLAVVDQFLDTHKKEADWLGTLTATCDYFVKDAESGYRLCCGDKEAAKDD